MPVISPIFINESDRLQILGRIRWWILAAQFVVIFTSYFLLDSIFPYAWLFLLLFLGVCVNFMSYSLVRSKNAQPWHTRMFLIFDLLQWTGILAVTGGIFNPFVPFILIPVVLSGAYMNSRNMMIISGVMLICLTFLIVPASQLNIVQWYSGPMVSQFMQGAIFSPKDISAAYYYLIMVFFTVFLIVGFHMMRKHALKYLGAQADSSIAFQEFQKSNAIGTIATAVIHELGTPLNTIQLIASDLKAAQCGSCCNTDDIEVLFEQTERCKTILQEMSQISRVQKNQDLSALGLSMVVEKIGNSYKNKNIKYDVFLRKDEKVEANMIWSVEVAYVIRNVLQNAFQFAQHYVDVQISWENDGLEIVIEDDGPGFPDGVIKKIGAPYVTGRTPQDQKEHMGLGLFVAKNLTEQTGGVLSVENKKSKKGARVTLSWRIDGDVYKRN